MQIHPYAAQLGSMPNSVFVAELARDPVLISFHRAVKNPISMSNSSLMNVVKTIWDLLKSLARMRLQTFIY